MGFREHCSHFRTPPDLRHFRGASMTNSTVRSVTSDPTSPPPSAPDGAAVRYLEPGRGTRFFNRVVARLTRMGISVWGSRVLGVVGRRSGEIRTTPVNLLTLDGTTYLVAARGHTQWVRNLRAAHGVGELRLGRHVDTFTSVELTGTDTVEVLRAYLRRWKFEVGTFFEGVDGNSSDDEILAIAAGHPVFRVTLAAT
jgi:deazaflavin-dependent oxidoreductase (nitroreductase family)